jgi:phosphoribosylformylglycinamidine synthase
MTDLSPLLAPQDEAAGKAHGLKPEEFQLIVKRLNRPPNMVELGIFSVMWSEN